MPTKDQLRSIEWAGEGETCPVCCWAKSVKGPWPHAAGCWLAAALASPAPQPVAPAPVWHGCKAGGAVCARYKPTGIGCAEGECDLASGVWAAPAPVEPPPARGSCRDRTCPKVKHLGTGYLHAEDDDTPYNVDGVRYCGRCHMVMDTPPPAKGKE